jgi:hypothetical protein
MTFEYFAYITSRSWIFVVQISQKGLNKTCFFSIDLEEGKMNYVKTIQLILRESFFQPKQLLKY